MARPTRQDRRARRAQQPALAGGPPARPPVRPVARGDAEPERRRPERRPQQEERHVPGLGAFRFIQEAIAELKKVEWPNQKQVTSGAAVVLIACAIVGTFLWLNDELWRYVVQHVLLR
jgi:preprotein translocase SecE subunit